jgi:large subunit ribosomal protein L17
MKKRVYGRKFSRGQGARKALLRSLLRALVAEGSIVTTKAKAKTVQKKAEKILNLAKDKNIAKRRRVYAILGNDRMTTDKLFEKIAPQFEDRVGGYTRIIHLPRRRGDLAEIARLEWVKAIVSVDAKKQTKSVKESKEKNSRKRPRIKIPGRKKAKKE